MFLSHDDVESIREIVKPFDTPERREQYRKGDFPRADAVKNLNVRYRWDTWYLAGSASHAFMWDMMDRYPDLKDSHIETALRKVIPDL